MFNLILTIHWWKSKFCGLGIAEVRFFQDSWVPSAWSVPLKRSEVMSADFSDVLAHSYEGSSEYIIYP